MRIFEGSSHNKVHFYCSLESAYSTNKSRVSPYCVLPLPFLTDIGVGLDDKFAQPGDHLAAPVGKFCDLLVDTFRWIHDCRFSFHMSYTLPVNLDNPSSTSFLLRFPPRSTASLFCWRRW